MSSLLLLPPLLLDCLLCLLFGRSLRPGRTALLTKLAQQARGHELDAKARRYTRVVTWVWASAAGLLASLLLAGLASPALRPLANVAAMGQGPFYLTLLVGEYLVRRRYLAHLPHMSLVRFLLFLRQVDYRAALRD